MTDNEILAARAVRFRAEVLSAASGPGGMIISFMRFDTRKPFQEGEPLHWYMGSVLDGVWGGCAPKPTVAEWFYGENTLSVTGTFLWSQMLRYQVTGEVEALETARKCFRDLNNYFRQCRALEPGLLGKPHGGRGGPTTSFDQAAIPVLPYVWYAQQLATPEEKAVAVENMAQHGEYYLRRNWVMNHHGNLHRVVDPAHTSTMKYLACVHGAYDLTGDVRFRDAAFKYLRQIIQSGRLPWPTNPYEINHNPWYWGMLCDYWRQTEMGGEYDWTGCIREYWHAMQTALTDDGMLLRGPYDTVQRTFTPYPREWVYPEDSARLKTLDPGESRIKKRWVSPNCFAGGAIPAAMLALLAHARGLDDEAPARALRCLQWLDEDKLRWWWDDGTLPDEMKGVTNVFAPEVAAGWLMVYWQGRMQGVW